MCVGGTTVGWVKEEASSEEGAPEGGVWHVVGKDIQADKDATSYGYGARVLSGGAMWGPECGPEVAGWRRGLDLAGWASEIRGIEKQVRSEQGERDTAHLHKMVRWTQVCWYLGLVLACASRVSVAGVLLLSTATFVQWTMIGHHVIHGGYSKLDKSGKYKRGVFAFGNVAKRLHDWSDWMRPEAWDVEHNHLHHYQLGEENDPDLVERNMHSVRSADVGLFWKYLIVLFFACTWKWTYYAPNTTKALYKTRKMTEFKKRGISPDSAEAQKGLTFSLEDGDAYTIFQAVEDAARGRFGGLYEISSVMLPYAVWHFGIMPAMTLAAGFPAETFYNCLTNLLIAEVLTNVHAFLVIAGNHVGDDCYRFSTPVAPKSDEFLLRAVIGSVNFPTGGDVNDMLHGFLNYQIEHHLWSDLSMVSYQKAAPLVREVCAKYGVPYVQQTVWQRVPKTVGCMVGTKSMKLWERGD